MNKLFLVKSLHTIHIDSYNEGEGDFVQHFELESTEIAENYKQAITNHLQDNGYNLDYNNCEISEDKISLETSCIVDKDNTQPSKNILTLWEHGKVTLYSDSISIKVHEANRIEFE